MTGVEKQSYESLEKTTSVQRVSETSKRVVIRGFQRVDQFIKDESGHKDVWLLFKYPKSEIAAELQRLENQTAKETPIEFSEVTATSAQNSGLLEMNTKPPGASVAIDGQSYGLTPVRVRLNQGSHSLFVDHPLFNYFEEKIIIQEGRTTRLNKVMTRAIRKIAIKTNPSGARITLGGKYLGISPIPETDVVVGEKQTLHVDHPEAQIFSSVVEVGKGESLHVVSVPDLTLKPSHLSVNSAPQGANVFIGGQSLGKTPTGFRAAGSGVLTVVKEGFVTHEEDIVLRGGERRPMQVSLKPLSEVEKERAIERQRIKNSPYILSIGLSSHSATHIFNTDQYSSTMAGLNLIFENKFWNLIGLRAQYAILGGKDDEMKTNTQSVRESTGSQLSGAIPVYLFNGLYVGPMVSSVSQEIKCKYTSVGCAQG